MNRLDGKAAIVTGAGGPTGSTIAARLAEEGAAVVLGLHRDLERGHEVRRRIESAGGPALVVEADVRSKEGAKALAEACLETFGRIDILVNNAAKMSGAPFIDMTEEQLDLVWDSALRAAFYCSQEVAKAMIEQRHGRIVSVSSIAASGSFANANYAVAKAGIEGLTRTLALELGRHNITVNCVAPGLIDSPKTQGMPPALHQRMIDPSAMRVAVEPIDVANAIVFFASDEARFVTGQVLHVSGGLDGTVRGMQELE